MAVPTKQPDLLDVARAAGVSRSTASRALLGHNRISETTRLRVLQAAESLGYVPDRRAVELATSTREKRGIGLLVRAAHHSFYGEMINAVQQVMEEAGRELIIASAIGDGQRQMATLNELRGRRIEGLIVASGRILEEWTLWFKSFSRKVIGGLVWSP